MIGTPPALVHGDVQRGACHAPNHRSYRAITRDGWHRCASAGLAPFRRGPAITLIARADRRRRSLPRAQHTGSALHRLCRVPDPPPTGRELPPRDAHRHAPPPRPLARAAQQAPASPFLQHLPNSALSSASPSHPLRQRAARPPDRPSAASNWANSLAAAHQAPAHRFCSVFPNSSSSYRFAFAPSSNSARLPRYPLLPQQLGQLASPPSTKPRLTSSAASSLTPPPRPLRLRALLEKRATPLDIAFCRSNCANSLTAAHQARLTVLQHLPLTPPFVRFAFAPSSNSARLPSRSPSAAELRQRVVRAGFGGLVPYGRAQRRLRARHIALLLQRGPQHEVRPPYAGCVAIAHASPRPPPESPLCQWMIQALGASQRVRIERERPYQSGTARPDRLLLSATPRP